MKIKKLKEENNPALWGIVRKKKRLHFQEAIFYLSKINKYNILIKDKIMLESH